VTTYLFEHPEFLDNHVTKHISSEQLETWVKKKARYKQAKESKDRIITDHYDHKDKIIADRYDLNDHDVKENGDHLSDMKHRLSQFSNRRPSASFDKRRLSDITRDIHTMRNEPHVLNELAAHTANNINANGYHLHGVEGTPAEIKHYCHTTNHTYLQHPLHRPVGKGTTLAAFVAHTKQPLRLSSLTTNCDYPEGIPLDGENTGPVLAQPVLQTNGNVAAVIEFFRWKGGTPFTEDEEEMSSNILFLADLCLRCYQMYNGMKQQRKLNEFLLTVTKSIFQDIVSMDSVIMKIMNFAKRLVNADRTALFLVDPKSKELFARVFDMGDDYETKTSPSTNKQKEIRFPMERGIAGHVASTGEILNIPNAYKDSRFNREVDLQTGYRTKTILCMPIFIRGNIIGVVQMLNKDDGPFVKEDEEAFETFAVYCGLALHHAKLYDKIRRSEQKYKVACEVLSYHNKAADDEIDKYIQSDIPESIERLTEYDYSPWAVGNCDKPLYIMSMFQDLLGIKNSRMDIEIMTRFTLTVRKNYRDVPYHNWAHAFSVAHAMYTVISTTNNQFSSLERLALFVAALCHDLDHRGKTNAFMVKSASPLAAMYSTSTMERHHFNQTIAILQHDGHNIFKHFSSEEYKHVLHDIKNCILATDLALFFTNKAQLKELNDKGKFSWKDKTHRDLLMAICMTASDLCSMFKPWDVQYQCVQVIMEEFWIQGDEEKSIGTTPIPMMDRDKSDELPASQVGFLIGICLPCYELLSEVLPNSKPMVEGAMNNLQKWKELATAKEENDRKKRSLQIRRGSRN